MSAWITDRVPTREDGEVWLPVVGYEGLYECSNCGNVRSLPRSVSVGNGSTRECAGRMLKPQPTDKGYYQVDLYKDGVGQRYTVHRIVAFAFISQPPSVKHQVNHIDGNKSNNHVSNLEWVTASYNRSHAYAAGLTKRQDGARNNFARLTDETVRAIRSEYATGLHTQGALATKYGVHRTTICYVVNNKTWAPPDALNRLEEGV